MKIGIASDHRGYKRKQQVLEYLRNKNYDVIDLGTDSEEVTDYNDYCIKLCNKIKENEVDYGILICWTGIGMSICANKIKGIYCAKTNNKKEAILSRKHNNVNTIAIPRRISFFKTKQIILSFLHTPFLEEERYKRRLDKLKLLEEPDKKSNKSKK